MFEFLKKVGRDESGATAVEYGLILALVFLSMIGAVSAFGEQAINLWNSVASQMEAATKG